MSWREQMFEWLKSGLSSVEEMFGAGGADSTEAFAIVAIMAGVSHCDGEVTEAEEKKFAAGFRINPALKAVDSGEMLRRFKDLGEQCEFDLGLGLDACIKDITAAAGRPEAHRIAVLRMGIASARADGDLGDKETAFLERAARALNLRLEQVLS